MERMTVEDVLHENERRIMQRVLAEEEQRRTHLIVYLSGAHAYGFPSPDSDLDLKAIHVLRTEDLLGFEVPATTVERVETLDGVEIDYTSNEIAGVLMGILQGNGNFIERLLGRMVAYESAILGDLRAIVRRSLSRRVHRHYRGFAHNQLRFLEKEPTAKRLLYVLRTALTGIHLLERGELETDLTRLMGDYELADAADLVERKRAGERVELPTAVLEAFRPRVTALLARLDAAREASPLPEEPHNGKELLDWLLALRRARLEAAVAGGRR